MRIKRFMKNFTKIAKNSYFYPLYRRPLPRFAPGYTLLQLMLFLSLSTSLLASIFFAGYVVRNSVRANSEINILFRALDEISGALVASRYHAGSGAVNYTPYLRDNTSLPKHVFFTSGSYEDTRIDLPRGGSTVPQTLNTKPVLQIFGPTSAFCIELLKRILKEPSKFGRFQIGNTNKSTVFVDDTTTAASASGLPSSPTLRAFADSTVAHATTACKTIDNAGRTTELASNGIFIYAR